MRACAAGGRQVGQDAGGDEDDAVQGGAEEAGQAGHAERQVAVHVTDRLNSKFVAALYSSKLLREYKALECLSRKLLIYYP